MHGADLQPWIDLWLNGQSRRWHLRFARKLEATFERDTGAERGRTLAMFTIAGWAAYLVWDFGSAITVVAPHARWLHAALATPVALAMAFLFRRGLPAILREALGAMLIAASAGSLTLLYVSFAWDSAALSTTGVIISMLMAAQVMQLRFPFAVASIAFMMAVQCAALWIRPPQGHESTLEFVQTLAVAGIIGLFAGWRQERDNRRTYLLGLKERLGRQALSQHNRELDDLTRRDPLTSLPNRRAFDAWLSTPTAEAAARLISLIAIDIDHFKPYNDHYGHPAGDACLRQVAACLRETARAHTDLVARIGGEEFAVLLVGATAAEAAQLAEHMRAAVEAMRLPHAAPNAGSHVTISAGVAYAYVLDNVPLPALAQRADAALYEAKQAGRNGVRVAE